LAVHKQPAAGAPASHTLINQLMEIARISLLAELASGIAHEINQPLGAIATFSQAGERMLSREPPMVGQALEVLRQIHHEAMNAGEGIRRIRRLFEQDETARMRCHLPELIAELHPVLDMLVQHIGGRLQIDEPPGLPAVMVDWLRIQHVLFALVQNACDASTEHASPNIWIRLSSDRYAVEVSVIDSGGGIPEGMADQLFKPFFTTKPRGTGLGLASSRAIIEAHGGTIGFENLPHGASRFWFRLPVA